MPHAPSTRAAARHMPANDTRRDIMAVQCAESERSMARLSAYLGVSSLQRSQPALYCTASRHIAYLYLHIHVHKSAFTHQTHINHSVPIMMHSSQGPSAARMLLCTCKPMTRACGQPPHTTHTNDEGRDVHPMAVASSRCMGETGRRLTHQPASLPAHAVLTMVYLCTYLTSLMPPPAPNAQYLPNMHHVRAQLGTYI